MFQLGDLVQLKSGGPTMVVTGINSAIVCTWLSDYKFRYNLFNDLSLRLLQKASSTCGESFNVGDLVYFKAEQTTQFAVDGHFVATVTKVDGQKINISYFANGRYHFYSSLACAFEKVKDKNN